MTVVGFLHKGTETNSRRLEPVIQQELDTATFKYVQVVNNCKSQYKDGSVFVFKSIEETMDFLNMNESKGALVIAHCGGYFDFQLLMRQF